MATIPLLLTISRSFVMVTFLGVPSRGLLGSLLAQISVFHNVLGTELVTELLGMIVSPILFINYIT